MTPDITDQHRWLHRFLGTWNVTSGEPGSEHFFAGTEVFRPLGDAWVFGEGRGTMGDSQALSLITIGYDPTRERFVGSWIGSMMTHLWISDGFLDADQRVLTLKSEGPSFTGKPEFDRYRDVFEFHNDDHRTLRAFVLEDEGQWKQFMTTEYRRA